MGISMVPNDLLNPLLALCVVVRNLVRDGDSYGCRRFERDAVVQCTRERERLEKTASESLSVCTIRASCRQIYKRKCWCLTTSNVQI